MDSDVRKKAWKKVKSIKRFYLHAASFAILGTFFFVMNMVTDPFFMWWFFPLIPWGVFLSFHYLFVFGIPGSKVLSREWEEREFEKQLEKFEEADHDQQYLGTGSYKGMHLEYTELSEDDALELRRIQGSSKGDKYFNEDFV